MPRLADWPNAATAAALQGKLETIHDVGGVIGTSVSALFLLIIGLANLLILKGLGPRSPRRAAAR